MHEVKVEQRPRSCAICGETIRRGTVIVVKDGAAAHLWCDAMKRGAKAVRWVGVTRWEKSR